MDTLQYKDIFISEALEHLDFLNQMLLALEKNFADRQSLNEIFRTAHTLKGMAATMGFDQITELTHQMENVLDKLRSSSTAVSQDIVNVLFQCLDTLNLLIEEISSSQPQNVNVRAVIDNLQRLEDGQAPVPAGPPAAARSAEHAAQDESTVSKSLPQIIAQAEQEGYLAYGVSVQLEEKCVFKGVRAFMVMKALSDQGEVVASVPGNQVLQEGDFDREFKLLLLSKRGTDLLRKSLRGIVEIESFDIDPVKAEEAESFWIQNKPVDSAPAAPAADPAPAKPNQAPSRSVQSIRVSIERLDNLQNLVGELVINKIRLSQICKQYDLKDLKEALAHFDRITNELQDEVTEVRMVPMEHIFNRFPRMVRDLAKESGKEIELVMEGKEIELDRTVLDEINDPLVHLLRNAVDHGIEIPEEREQCGKTRSGLVRLSASREKNHVIIKVTDDGRGIDARVVRRVAVERGMISQEEADRLNEQEAINLVAMPGVTTAKVVTEVSGRGVGVDAVRSKIESFGGHLKIESELGQGSTFILRMPLTLAIIQALLIRVGKEVYSVPVINTVETLDLEMAQIKFVQHREVVLYRDSVLPLVRLHQVLEVPDPEENGLDRAVLVTEVGDMRVGLLVDQVLGQQEIAIKSLGPMLKGVRGFSGVTILGDGRVALVLDVPTLIV